RLAGQAADFEDQLRLTVIEDGDLGAGRLALVLEADAAAEADDALGQRGAGDGPARPVNLMDALIAEVAVAEVPEPVPAVVDEVRVKGLLGSGAGPDVEV